MMVFLIGQNLLLFYNGLTFQLINLSIKIMFSNTNTHEFSCIDYANNALKTLSNIMALTLIYNLISF